MTNEIPGLVANQQNPDYQQLVNNWTPYDSSINMPPYTRSIPSPNTTYVDFETLRKTRISQEQLDKAYHETINKLTDYLNRERNQKSPVSALLDDLFSLEEKFEYLLSMGYRKIEGSSYLVKGEPDPEFKRTFTVEEAFLEEMKIKLKNVLLSKQALKFKI